MQATSIVTLLLSLAHGASALLLPATGAALRPASALRSSTLRMDAAEDRIKELISENKCAQNRTRASRDGRFFCGY